MYIRCWGCSTSVLLNFFVLISCGFFFFLKIIELPNNRVFSSGVGHKKAVRHIQFTADGKTLISSSEDSVIQVSG